MKRHYNNRLKSWYIYVPVLFVLVNIFGCQEVRVMETTIIIYQNGKKHLVKQGSPYFERLQKDIEDVFLSCDQRIAAMGSDSAKAAKTAKKNKAIEILYINMKEFNLEMPTLEEMDQRYPGFKESTKNYKPIDFVVKTDAFLIPIGLGIVYDGKGKYYAGTQYTTNDKQQVEKLKKTVEEYLAGAYQCFFEIAENRLGKGDFG